MATADEYAAWIVKNADKRGSPEFETVAKAYQLAKGEDAPAAPDEPFPAKLGRAVLNASAGAVRGAGSIGATLLSPIDAAARALGVQNDYIGRTDRREAMDEALRGLGADAEGIPFKAGKLGTEIAGTLGAGGVLAGGARALGAGAPIVNALQSAGMTTGGRAPGVMNLLKDLALRSAAGGAVGGASTAMIDPEHAGTGAAIGAAMPPALAVAGKVGQVAGRVINGPAIDADTIAAIKAARSAGYVIPPTQAKPTLSKRVLEGFSGKITTAQNASAKNQGVTAKLAAEALGLPGDTKITPDVLTTVRKAAGQAYDAIGGTGTVTPGVAYDAALDAIAAPHLKAAAGFPNAKASPVVDLVESLRSPTFDAAAAVAKIKELRSAADDAFRTGNTDIGRASKAAAKALEDVLDTHLQGLGSPDMLQQFRDARQLIAKTYSVEKALNPATGAIDARKLGAQIKAGKPLSGGLRDAGEFALRFPKAAQTVEGMGSLPQTSPLDWIPAGALSAATSNPLMMAGVFARPAARAAALSPMVQNRLATQNSLMQMLQQNPDALNLLYRATPVGLAADR